MAEVVQLTKSKRRIDMRGDNRLPALLDEREQLKSEMSILQSRLKELDTELRDKLGDAHQMITDGWLVSNEPYIRKAYTVKATTMHRLSARRISKRIYDKL